MNETSGNDAPLLAQCVHERKEDVVANVAPGVTRSFGGNSPGSTVREDFFDSESAAQFTRCSLRDSTLSPDNIRIVRRGTVVLIHGDLLYANPLGRSCEPRANDHHGPHFLKPSENQLRRAIVFHRHYAANDLQTRDNRAIEGSGKFTRRIGRIAAKRLKAGDKRSRDHVRISRAAPVSVNPGVDSTHLMFEIFATMKSAYVPPMAKAKTAQ